MNLTYGGSIMEGIITPKEFLNWVTGKANKPEQLQFKAKWVLARCTDGITWGIIKNGTWELANNAFPHCPTITTHNLLELRIFGEQGEALLWQDGHQLAGRLLIDSEGTCSDCSSCSQHQDLNNIPLDTDPLAPFCQEQILVGSHYRNSVGNFVHVANSAGREQVLPIPEETLPPGFKSGKNSGKKQSPFRLRVKYYVSKEPCGAVRISAARLVKLGVVL